MNTTHLIISSSAALIILLLELLRCIKEELTCIWRVPFTFVKATYVFVRYFPLLVHLTNIFLFAQIKPPFPIELCQKWLLFQHLSTISVQTPLDAVVWLRVFALYNCTTTIGILAIVMVTIDAATSLLVGTIFYHREDFGSLCSTRPGKLAFVIPATLQISQGVMWCLASYKKYFIKKILGTNLRTEVPFLPIVFRDGSLVLAGVTLSIALSVPYSVLIRMETHVLYPWVMTLLSILCCRSMLSTCTNTTTDAETENVELDDLGVLTPQEAPPVAK